MTFIYIQKKEDNNKNTIILVQTRNGLDDIFRLPVALNLRFIP